jgi:ADP-ribose pyrophosphatase
MTEQTSSKVIWQGSSWRMVEVDVPLTDGSIHRKGVIEHPGAVVLVPVQDGMVYMIRQYRLALKQTILELPAGTREWDEDWLVCCQRELREEIGFRAEQFVEIGRIWPSPGLSNELMVIYLAKELSAAPLPQDPDEQIEVSPMTLAEVTEMVGDGRIQDAKTIVGISRAATYLNL